MYQIHILSNGNECLRLRDELKTYPLLCWCRFWWSNYNLPKFAFWQVCSSDGVCLPLRMDGRSRTTHERIDISSPNLVHILGKYGTLLILEPIGQTYLSLKVRFHKWLLVYDYDIVESDFCYWWPKNVHVSVIDHLFFHGFQYVALPYCIESWLFLINKTTVKHIIHCLVLISCYEKNNKQCIKSCNYCITQICTAMRWRVVFNFRIGK